MLKITKRKTCRICNNPHLTTVIDFGEMYLAGYTPKKNDPNPIQEKAPMVLVRCDKSMRKNSCGLVQLFHTVDSDLMYRRYFYRSGINITMKKNLKEIVQQATRFTQLEPKDVVIDIGCNDGTLLKNYQNKNLTAVGFDPAKNMLQYSKESGADIITNYFDSEIYFKKYEKDAKIITSIAMFYDLEDPNKFVDGISKVLDKDGLWVMELAYLPLTLSQLAFDTVVHEHLEYYHLGSLEYLLHKHGLKVIDVFLNDVNGGSFRIFIKHKDATIQPDAEKRIFNLREKEKKLDINSNTPYDKFVKNINKEKKKLISFLKKEIKSGKTIYGYGASTKGATLLQYYGIDNSLISAIADRNPDKWNRTTIGTNIPIISEKKARSKQPDYFLVLPWHFIKEFSQRERKFLSKGGKLITPLPKFEVIPK